MHQRVQLRYIDGIIPVHGTPGQTIGTGTSIEIPFQAQPLGLVKYMAL